MLGFLQEIARLGLEEDFLLVGTGGDAVNQHKAEAFLENSMGWLTIPPRRGTTRCGTGGDAVKRMTTWEGQWARKKKIRGGVEGVGMNMQG